MPHYRITYRYRANPRRPRAVKRFPEVWTEGQFERGLMRRPPENRIRGIMAPLAKDDAADRCNTFHRYLEEVQVNITQIEEIEAQSIPIP